MNVFESVKENVTARQAAEMYGIRVNRNGMACCPFHDDKHPSMKVDKRFHCFGCQEDGDVIDFAAKLYGLNSLGAAVKLAADFGIDYDSKGRASPRPAKRNYRKNCGLNRQGNSVSEFYQTTIISWKNGKQNMRQKSPRRNGILCLWRLYRSRHTSSICWISF